MLKVPKDTLSLIHHDALQKAVQILRRSQEVRIFAYIKFKLCW